MRGSEEDLCNLENEWDRINIQTSWKLEVCYKLVENPPPQDQDQASANCESDAANHDSGADKSILSETTSLQDTTQSCPEHPLAKPSGGDPPEGGELTEKHAVQGVRPDKHKQLHMVYYIMPEVYIPSLMNCMPCVTLKGQKWCALQRHGCVMTLVN